MLKSSYAFAYCLIAFVSCKTGMPVASQTKSEPPEPTKTVFQCADGEELAHSKLRIVAANISSGNKQNYDGGEGKRILMGLKPDVVLLQEFNYKSFSDADYQEFADSVIAPIAVKGQPAKAHYTVDTQRQLGHRIPNGILSRYPLIAKGDWIDAQIGDRDFTWARIDIPGNRELFAVSVHLKASSDGKSNKKRIDQATALMQNIAKETPSTDFAVIGGDFNTTKRDEEPLKIFTGVTKLPDLQNPRFFSDKHVPVSYQKDIPTPISGTNANRRNNYDWVLPDQSLDELHAPVVVGLDSERKLGVNFFPEGLVFDSRTFKDLSLVAPVQIGDSGATGMQHMAIVRDFSVPYCIPANDKK